LKQVVDRLAEFSKEFFKGKKSIGMVDQPPKATHTAFPQRKGREESQQDNLI